MMTLPAVQLHALANSLGLAAALHAAVRLGVADVLGDAPLDAKELAVLVDADPDALHRLLRALAAHGVFERHGDRSYGHNDLSRPLRRDQPGSRADMVLLAGASWAWQVWPRLDEAVRTGKTVFPDLFGTDLFGYLSTVDPVGGALFDRAMSAGSDLTGRAVADTLQMTGVRRFADIGGGQGALVRQLLDAHSDVDAVLFDLPKVVAQPVPELTGRGRLADRCYIVSGDCRRAVPVSADLYLLKHVLHMWDDAEAVAVLRAVAVGADAGARVVVVEQLLDRAAHVGIAALLDLLMLLNLGGRERTEDEFAALFAEAGLEYVGSTPTATPVCLIEARVPCVSQSARLGARCSS